MSTKIIFIIILTFLALASSVSAIDNNLTFGNCSDYTFYVDVVGFGDIYEGAYDIEGCDLINSSATEHRWKCDCLDTLNLSFKTLYALDRTYTLSVMSVSKDVDYDSIKDYENSEIFVKTFTFDERMKSNNTLTGAVIGPGIKVGVISFIILLLLIGILFSIHYLGGAPWQDRSKRAMNLHKKGQHAFESSKLNKAKRYYKRAARLRK